MSDETSVTKSVNRLLSSLQSARDNPALNDFKLHCGGKTFPCNKFILALRSPVLGKIFSHEAKEEAEAEKEHLVVEDCTPEALEVFLQILYAGKAQNANQHAL